jgi:competence protein ComEA
MRIRGVPEPGVLPEGRRRGPGRGPPHAPPHGGDEPLAERSAASLVWAPVGVRVVAVGIALLGLAGIGSVVGRAAGHPATAGVARAGLGLTPLSGEAWAALSLATPSAVPNGASATPSEGRRAGEGSPRPLPDAAPLPAAGIAPAAPDVAGVAPAGVAPSAPCPTAASPSGAPGAAAPAAARLNLNLASAAELRALPGIGAKRAEGIVALRQRLGRFRRPSDLLRIKGIGPRTLERLLPQVSVE